MSTLIVLVHGIFKTPHDMRFLESGLKRAGFEVFCVKLPTTFSRLSHCAEVLAELLVAKMRSYEEVKFVAHSMGGLIVRDYLANYHPPKVTASLFIATPHHGSALADIATKIPLISRVFPALLDLKTKRRETIQAIDKAINIGIILGSKNNLLRGRFFLSKQSDGLVEMESAKATDASETLILPYGHLEIHFKVETLKAVEKFLNTGHLN